MINFEQHPDGEWITSRYYYKNRLLLVKSKMGRGMKCHIFHPDSDKEVDFTMRWSFVRINNLLEQVQTKIDKREQPRKSTVRISDSL